MSDEKLARNPLAMPAEEIYSGESSAAPSAKPKRRPKRDVVLATFSLYPEDIAHLEGLLETIKGNGQRGANKSRLVRQALARFRAKDFKQPR